MSEQETKMGKIRLVPNIEGETTYEKKATELLRTLRQFDEDDFQEYYAEEFPENWVEVLNEYQDYRDPQYMILDSKIYEILSIHDLESEYFCKVIKHENGEIDFIASWYNGGACLEEVLNDGMKDT